MTTGIGISIYFGVGEFGDSAAPSTPQPIRRREPSPEVVCHHGSPDSSGGHWYLEGREYRRDCSGRVWVKKQPLAQLSAPKDKAKPGPKTWKSPPSPPAENRQAATASSSSESSPKLTTDSRFEN